MVTLLAAYGALKKLEAFEDNLFAKLGISKFYRKTFILDLNQVHSVTYLRKPQILRNFKDTEGVGIKHS